MIEGLTQVAIGGILALLILREVFDFIRKRRAYANDNHQRRPTGERLKEVANGVDAVLSRLDRIIERLDEVAAATKSARKQTEITGEMAERMSRAVSQLEETINDVALRRRTADTSPGVQG